MKKRYFSVENDGFYGAYFVCSNPTDRCMIAMLGDTIDDHMVVSAVKWLHRRNCNVMTLSPGKKDYGHHNYPLERIGSAIAAIKKKGNQKIGIVGASTTGMLARFAFRAARQFPKECRATRIDIDRKIAQEVLNW